MIKLLRKFRHYFLGIKLKNKLLLSYIVFLFLPLYFSLFTTFKSFSSVLEKNVIYSVEKNYNQTFSFLTEKLNKIKKTSDIILVNDNVNNMFIANSFYSDADNYFSMKKSMDFLSSFEDEDIARIVLFLYEDEDYDLSYYFNDTKSIKSSMWYETINLSNMNLLWCPSSYLENGIPTNIKPDSENFALVRRFNSPANYLNTLGYYCIYFHSGPIKNIVNMGDAVNGSVTFLQNSKGELIYASNQEQYNNLYTIFERRTEEEYSTSLLKTCKAGGEKLIYAQKQFANSDWSLITLISYDNILSQVKLVRERMSIVTLLLSVVCFALALMVAHSMTKRILQLQKKMKQAEQGNFNPEGKNIYKDEIGYLTDTYDFMVEKINELMKERYKAGIQVKAAELKALQEQINPHFLYNTLDTINWLAQKGSTAEVEKAISALAEFYRLSLNNGDDEIPIREELKQISNYVQIQNIRFSGSIHLIIDIDEEVSNYLILKLILQPFVENSILHGIMNKPSKEGYIIIEAKIEDENVKIIIQDNGVGMSEEELVKINDGSHDEKHSGFGIKNVRKRILLNYGSQYGIRFASSPGTGTTAEITIPAKYYE